MKIMKLCTELFLGGAALVGAITVADLTAGDKDPGMNPGEYHMSANFSGPLAAGRVCRDIDFPCDMTGGDGFAFEIYVPDWEQFARFSAHCLSVKGQWSYHQFGLPDVKKWVTMEIRVNPKKKTEYESSANDFQWKTIQKIRISAWRNWSRGTSKKAWLAVRNFRLLPKGYFDNQYAAQAKDAEKASQEAVANLRKTPPQAGERRMVWIHNYNGMYKKDWDQSALVAKKCGMTDMIANLAWGCKASYRSKVLETAKVAVRPDGEKDWFDLALEACHKHGLKMHAWNVSWGTWKMDAAEIKALGDAGRLAVMYDNDAANAKGENLYNWLCPTHPQNRKQLVESMVEMAERGADGIHFDYIRYIDDRACFCPRCHELFEKQIGKKASPWPGIVRTDGEMATAWEAFRKECITSVIRETAEKVRKLPRKVEISCAVFEDGDYRGQDWRSWGKMGYMDLICTMSYVSCPLNWRNTVSWCLRQDIGNAKLIPGIGVDVWKRDGYAAARYADYIRWAREMKAPGFAPFEMKWTLERLYNNPELLPAVIGMPAGGAAE